MKVKFPGPHPSVVKEVICKNCGATLEYVPADIQEKTVVSYPNDQEVLYYIVCPCCSHEISVRRY